MPSDDWISLAIHEPAREFIQQDGRIRRWAQIAEMESRYRQVVLLAVGEAVNNAFIDGRFEP